MSTAFPSAAWVCSRAEPAEQCRVLPFSSKPIISLAAELAQHYAGKPLVNVCRPHEVPEIRQVLLCIPAEQHECLAHLYGMEQKGTLAGFLSRCHPYSPTVLHLQLKELLLFLSLSLPVCQGSRLVATPQPQPLGNQDVCRAAELWLGPLKPVGCSLWWCHGGQALPGLTISLPAPALWMWPVTSWGETVFLWPWGVLKHHQGCSVTCSTSSILLNINKGWFRSCTAVNETQLCAGSPLLACPRNGLAPPIKVLTRLYKTISGDLGTL